MGVDDGLAIRTPLIDSQMELYLGAWMSACRPPSASVGDEQLVRGKKTLRPSGRGTDDPIGIKPDAHVALGRAD